MIGLFAGTAAAGEWRTYLLWANRTDFGRTDRFFGQDIGFYVFELPWLHYLVNFAMAALVISLLAAATVHYLYGGIRLQTPGDRLTGAAQVQFSVLLGLFVLAKAADYWLDRYDLVSASGNLIDGITYTDDHAVLPAKNILLGIAVICAVLFFLNIWRRTWTLPSVGLALLVLSAILLGMIWPGIVQAFQVRPTEPDKEAPYIADNIAATREAYDLQDVERRGLLRRDGRGLRRPRRPSRPTPRRCRWSTRSWCTRPSSRSSRCAPTTRSPTCSTSTATTSTAPTARWCSASASSTSAACPTTRATGPTCTPSTPTATASSRRSPTSARPTTAARAPRSSGPRASRRTRTRCPRPPAATRAGSTTASRAPTTPSSASSRGPTTSSSTSAGSPTAARPRRTTARAASSVGSTFRKLLYAVKFGDPNFLLSERVNENSKVLYIRNPRERVQKVAPWLTVDSDAYPAVVDGRILWIVDGYTTTDRYPLAEKESIQTMTDDSLTQANNLPIVPTDQINYMRNAVKATVDAYDGTVRLYAWDETDPMLEAWRNAFPGTVLPREEMPEELVSHLRYPEDLFKVQRYQFARYHVTDAGHLLPEGRLVGGAERPRAGRQAAAAVPPVRAGPRDRRRQVLADLGLRAVQQEQPGGLRLRRLRRDRPRDLRPDPGAAAAQREHPGPGQHRQRDAVRPRRHRGAAAADPGWLVPGDLRQPADACR